MRFTILRFSEKWDGNVSFRLDDNHLGLMPNISKFSNF